MPAPNRSPLSRTDSAAVVELADTLSRRLEERLQDLLDERLTQGAVRSGPPPLLDVADVAERLKVSTRTVERIIASGQLRPLWIEGQRRFTSAAVEAYLKKAAKRGSR